MIGLFILNVECFISLLWSRDEKAKTGLADTGIPQEKERRDRQTDKKMNIVR